jgi:hypothetical protein
MIDEAVAVERHQVLGGQHPGPVEGGDDRECRRRLLPQRHEVVRVARYRGGDDRTISVVDTVNLSTGGALASLAFMGFIVWMLTSSIVMLAPTAHRLSAEPGCREDHQSVLPTIGDTPGTRRPPWGHGRVPHVELRIRSVVGATAR